MSAPAAANGKLALDPRDVELTLQPVERATMLPPAAFADETVLSWEMDNIFDGWVCIGHVSAVAEQGSFLMRELGDTSVFAERMPSARCSSAVPRFALNAFELGQTLHVPR